ncbi:Acyl-[acyl-carrier-protein]--UDP-N-acetylglucosamine O-acyltransferase [Phycisphaerae bacterium RAS1]|nr:Acyl-[acyl-carrier-protein]--UDP-N-acetylglucosamine O-acyltransferase [Phycisphaerae bacterium RAS1]
MAIHVTAVVDRRAEIDPSAEVGAYAIIETGVKIGPETRIWPHAYISAGTTIGCRVQVHPHAVVGHHPQDFAWKGSPSYTQIGDETIIRECATVHRGTLADTTTVVGKRCFLMACSHVGHNCVLGDDVKIANGGLLSGYVSVGDKTFISGLSGVHQFVRIGELVMLSGGTRVVMDIPPFMIWGPHGVTGPNVIGLRRAGLTGEERLELRKCHHLLYRSGLHFREAVARVAEFVRFAPGKRLAAFLAEPSKRGIGGYRHAGRRVGDSGDGADV